MRVVAIALTVILMAGLLAVLGCGKDDAEEAETDTEQELQDVMATSASMEGPVPGGSTATPDADDTVQHD